MGRPLIRAESLAAMASRTTKAHSDYRHRGGDQKLEDADVRAIRRAGQRGIHASVVARIWDITESYASLVMRGDTHRHVR